MESPIIQDQYTAARAYFACVIGLLCIESAIHAPSYLLALRKSGHSYIKPSHTHFKIYVFFHKLATIPSYVPFVTNHHIPDLLRFTAFVGLNVLFGLNENEYSTDFKLYGWLTIANGGLALLMASRTNLFSLVARIPSSTLLLYHRWIGLATVVNATLHFSLTTNLYIRTDQIETAFSNSRQQVGIMAWLSLCLIAITSIGFIRRRYFEVFYYSHALFFVFVVGALIHTTNGPEFLLPGLILWVFDRIIRFVNNFRSVQVKSVIQYPGNLTKFTIEGLKTTHPNQMAWIQIPGVSFINWHPFTIASAPGDKETVFAVRGLGGYTKKLQCLAEDSKDASQGSNAEEMMSTQTKMAKIRLDGPYGVGHLQWGLYPVIVLVAGGVGITPGISIAAHILKTASLPESKSNGPDRWNIHLSWTVKDIRHTKWFEEELKHMATLAADPMVPATLDVTINVTGANSSQPESSGMEEMYTMDEQYSYRGPGTVVQGRPNLVEWFRDVKNRRPGLDASVNACGPRPLIDAARKAAASASSENGVFYVEEEVFEL